MFRSLASLTFATGALATGKPVPAPATDGPSGNGLNSIKCTAIAFGGAETYSKSAFLDFGVELGGKICGEGKDSLGVELVATDVAAAAAKAIAATFVECTTEGKSVYGFGEAKAHVTASAQAWAEAIGRGWASIETCSGCVAAMDVLVESSKDLFVKVIAESTTHLEAFGAADGRAKYYEAGELIEHVKQQIEPVLVSIFAEVGAIIDGGEEACGVRIKTCAIIGDDGACCDVTTGAAAKAVSSSEIAATCASEVAVSYTCGGDPSDAVADTWAEAIAEAYAAAFVSVQGYCAATDNSSVCLWTGAQVSAFAHAQAFAFADAWAQAANGCGCELSTKAVAFAFEKVFIEAHARIEGDVCLSGGELVEIDVVKGEIKEASVTAIASALAVAWQDEASCGVEVEACAAAGDDNHACCTATVEGYPEAIAEDANAEALALASGFICPGEAGAADLEASADVFVKAVAKAMAIATIDFDQHCKSTGKAGFCSGIEGWLTAHATAQARAFAEAWAATPYGCGCEVEAEKTAEVLETLYITVTQDIHRSTCQYGEAWHEDSDTLVSIAEGHKVAIARAIATIKSNGKNCEATATAGAGTTDDKAATEEDVETETEKDEFCEGCVWLNQQCAGRDDTGPSVVGCCDPSHVCVRRTNLSAVCKKPRSNAIRRFKRRGFGQTLTCPKLNAH